MGVGRRAPRGCGGELQRRAGEAETALGSLGHIGGGPAVGKPEGSELCRWSAVLRCRIASSRGWERGVEVADEGDELGGDDDAWEEQSHSEVNTARGVGAAGDIPGVDGAPRGSASGVNPLEDVVDLGVATPS